MGWKHVTIIHHGCSAARHYSRETCTQVYRSACVRLFYGDADGWGKTSLIELIFFFMQFCPKKVFTISIETHTKPQGGACNTVGCSSLFYLDCRLALAFRLGRIQAGRAAWRGVTLWDSTFDALLSLYIIISHHKWNYNFFCPGNTI
jgi:hypothetical protein